MQILFDGDVYTDYNQIYVESRPDSDAAFETVFNGQVNGLCGGASPGFLYLSTGLHAGHVGFTVELHEEVPPVDDFWEDVVEVPFRPSSETLHVVQLFREAACSLAVPQVDLRVRFCAHGMDEAAPLHFVPDDEPTVDRYLLQFWPAAPSADRVLRRTSAVAAYRHDWVRTLPPPPTPEEQAEAERRRAEAERQAQLESQEAWERMQDEMFWGGVRPSDRLRNLQANVIGLAQLDRNLVDTLAAADPDLQRSVARWATRRAWDAAGLSSLTWAAPALAALERGENLPAPFDDQTKVWGMLLGEDRQVRNVHVRTTGPPRIEVPTNIDPQFAAMPAIFAAVEADTLRAAVDAVFAATVTFGHEYPLLLGELRKAFPALA
jgi:hypothetical protein